MEGSGIGEYTKNQKNERFIIRNAMERKAFGRYNLVISYRKAKHKTRRI